MQSQKFEVLGINCNIKGYFTLTLILLRNMPQLVRFGKVLTQVLDTLVVNVLLSNRTHRRT